MKIFKVIYVISVSSLPSINLFALDKLYALFNYFFKHQFSSSVFHNRHPYTEPFSTHVCRRAGMGGLRTSDEVAIEASGVAASSEVGRRQTLYYCVFVLHGAAAVATPCEQNIGSVK